MFCRQNQELERYSASMLEDKLRLQEQANSLEQRLEAVLHDKFHAKSFDAETPIDKTLAYLHNVIKVINLCQLLCLCFPAMCGAFNLSASPAAMRCCKSRHRHIHQGHC